MNEKLTYMLDEQKELKIRISRVAAIMSRPHGSTFLLKMQIRAMINYSDILAERIRMEKKQ